MAKTLINGGEGGVKRLASRNGASKRGKSGQRSRLEFTS